MNTRMQPIAPDSPKIKLGYAVIVASILIVILQMLVLLVLRWEIRVEIGEYGLPSRTYSINPWMIRLPGLLGILAVLWWYFFRQMSLPWMGWTMLGNLAASIVMGIVAFCLTPPTPKPTGSMLDLDNRIQEFIHQEIDHQPIKMQDTALLHIQAVETLRSGEVPTVVRYGD